MCNFTIKLQNKMLHFSGLIFCLLCCCNAVFGTTTSDIITSSNFLKDPQTIISKNNVFSLGFFSPINSSNRYVGIWYNKPSSAASEMNIIWVANRDVPINDRKGQLLISDNEKSLTVLNGKKKVIWSSDTLSKNVSTVQLLDSGNLVVFSMTGVTLWQSFDHPINSVLPNMEITATPATMKRVLQSWSSPSDPSIGRFSLGTDSLLLPQLIIWDGDRPYWRSGPWSGNIFIGIEYNNDITYTGWRFSYEGQGRASMMYTYPNTTLLSFYELDYQGTNTQRFWDENKGIWDVLWQAPESECSVYGKCGEFGYGTCMSRKSPICQCLKGFVPRNKVAWNKGNWSQGCVRRTPLECRNDGFLKLSSVKVPDHADVEIGYVEDQCREACFMNCFCLAYSYYSGIGCMLWNTSLIDIVELSGGGAADLYLRLADSELVVGDSKKVNIIIGAAGAAAVTCIAAAVFICVIWKQRILRRVKRSKTLLEILEGSHGLDKFEDLSLFRLGKLAAATNNFQESNKLGLGGFGPVYRGLLEDGLEVAVKRLSGTSTQGVEEFMNEVLVISKLQHRNLVKLLGCCVERQERMLIYEYMPNKSLDAFLFDSKKKEILDWKKRSSIIDGISRGLLYLHRDSRLKIIHRDLKAGNILLDENLIPKISDFGMARIFQGDQRQADTRRVVGTYGYMPPEYAIEGRFSEKSDVFSFGVLLLEILTGKKTQWYDEESVSLLGYVWKHWSEDNIFPLIDPVISDQGFEEEILKSLHLGLLCVQEYAGDRPDISAVISMLSAETAANFRQPKPPGFTRLLSFTENTASQKQRKGSMNGLSITDISCR